MSEISVAAVDLAALLTAESGSWHATAVRADGLASATLTADGLGGWAVEVIVCQVGDVPRKNSGSGYFSRDVIPGLLCALGFGEAESAEWSRAATDQCTRSVYFIQADNGLIKIGVSDDPASRFAKIRTMSPVPLRLMGVIPGAGDAGEDDLHRRFAAHRAHGEWFRSSPELLTYITANAVGGFSE